MATNGSGPSSFLIHGQRGTLLIIYLPAGQGLELRHYSSRSKSPLPTVSPLQTAHHPSHHFSLPRCSGTNGVERIAHHFVPIILGHPGLIQHDSLISWNSNRVLQLRPTCWDLCHTWDMLQNIPLPRRQPPGNA